MLDLFDEGTNTKNLQIEVLVFCVQADAYEMGSVLAFTAGY